MEAIFIKLLNMSITAGLLALAVIVIRLLLKKAPKAITIVMWALVGIRLICPFSFESVLSLIPSAETIPENIIYSVAPEIQSGIPALNSTINPIISESLAPAARDSVNPMRLITFIAFVIWIVGMIAMILYAIISYIRIYRKVREAAPFKNNIWLCDHIPTSFILGIIRPRIYLPSDIDEKDMEYVIAHEKAHLKRRDHLWKPLAFLLLTVYWFNPVLWIAYILFCRDIEFACDEKVIKEMGSEIKKPYSDALINCSAHRKMITACPLAFGEVGVKGRIKSVLNYKKPAFWVIILAVAICIPIAVGFLTNPKTEEWKSENYGIYCNVISAECENIVYDYLYGTINEEYPYITVNWTNDTDDTLCFGNEFVIYKNGKIYEPRKEMYFNLELHTIKPGENKSENYILSEYELSEGNYQLEKTFYLEREPEQKYRAFISFSIERTYSFLGKQYKGEKIVYECGSYSSILYTNESIPQFSISDVDFHLLTNDYPQTSVKNSFYDIGKLKKITLKKSNFDDMTTADIWYDGYSASELRKNNLNAFSAFDSSGRLYYLLEQKNGEIYIAQGYTETNTIRWIFKMKSTKDVPPEEQAPDITSDTISALKKKYPQYFDLTTTKGLVIYVWQMGEDSYFCGLLSGKNIGYSNEDLWNLVPVSIDEMRVIIQSYNISKSKVTIWPVIQPYSSYFYEIDDDYRKKVENLFWGEMITESSTDVEW